MEGIVFDRRHQTWPLSYTFVKVSSPDFSSAAGERRLSSSASLALAVCVGTFGYYYVKYGRMIEDKLAAGPFANTSLLYAAPRPVMIGDDGQLDEIGVYLRRCGYTESNTNRLGWYHLRPDAIEINPGPDALRFGRRGDQNRERAKSRRSFRCAIRPSAPSFMLEPELITNLFDQKREKRRVVQVRRYSAR